MRSSLRSPAAALALTVLTVVAGPARADDHTSASPSPSASPTADPDDPDDPLTDVTDLERQADELEQQVREQQTAVTAEQERLAVAQAEAARALEAYQQAQRAADLATRAAAEEAERVRQAIARTEAARGALNAYVGGLYRQGMGTQHLSVYNSLMGTRGPDAFLTGLSLAERVGANRGGVMSQLAQAQAEQQAAEQRARAAQEAATAASATAAQAKVEADAVVARVTQDVLASTEVLLRTQGAAAAAEKREADRRALLAKAEQIAAQRAAVPFAAVEGSLVPRVSADCVGGLVAGYPNGQLPPSALCPLWGTSGQMLRADAAAAFNDMSRAYAQEFGAPICVTDSYRTYAEQVAVRAAKPGLAAVPGTSNHGWAVAVDLCDGVQTFGTPTHDWLRRHSLRFGWFLPAWAMPGGSKPEPWHWEFAG